LENFKKNGFAANIRLEKDSGGRLCSILTRNVPCEKTNTWRPKDAERGVSLSTYRKIVPIYENTGTLSAQNQTAN
jgi:hypothetical protein